MGLVYRTGNCVNSRRFPFLYTSICKYFYSGMGDWIVPVVTGISICFTWLLLQSALAVIG